MEMFATVIWSDPQSMLVRDSSNGEEVLVIYPNADDFVTGDQVMIEYNGAMTLSIPPQISASSVQRVQGITPPEETQPEELPVIRGIVLQRSLDSLLVWDMENRREVIVNYTFSNHFCIRQQVVVEYDSITLGNPIRVNAANIMPVC